VTKHKISKKHDFRSGQLSFPQGKTSLKVYMFSKCLEIKKKKISEIAASTQRLEPWD